ncbi:hypothetical protein EDD37DRAFT_603875 [Exophiala viscosa]|uniref:Uncharacterized protein n=1 Tax=Exophiala viscosa TaxID=2486360 RepID=A0AAN6DT01_9EURO|nr:hypothetical protein EDD36DRAFT_421337 [Exophiala viscosa]KAI1628963.1 hypothetical protein EDD37DRAFT_603875 [Exophiala viscosa]
MTESDGLVLFPVCGAGLVLFGADLCSFKQLPDRLHQAWLETLARTMPPWLGLDLPRRFHGFSCCFSLSGVSVYRISWYTRLQTTRSASQGQSLTILPNIGRIRKVFHAHRDFKQKTMAAVPFRDFGHRRSQSHVQSET